MFKKMKKNLLHILIFLIKKFKIRKFIKRFSKKLNRVSCFIEAGYIDAILEDKEDANKFIEPKEVFSKKNHRYTDEELREHMNKLFERQEKERIVRWLIDSIRESLDLENVLEKAADEIGRLLNADKCFIALYDKTSKNFYFHGKYEKSENVSDVSDNLISKLPRSWQEHLLKSTVPVVINDFDANNPDEEQKNYLKINNIKSLIILPIIHKNEVLGAITVYQIHNERIKWESIHLEILKDTSSQIAIAVKQAMLYTKEQETTKLKSAFLAGMSHEFRTPLSTIIGFSDMLLSKDFGELNDKQRKFVKNVALSGKHLLKLVNDVLDFSKAESGNMTLCYEEFTVNLLIYETVSALNSMAIKKNISIETNLTENITINADAVKFRQIMYNLLSNAVKFTEQGGQIRINSTLSNNNLEMEIIDTGIGITEENRDKVFLEFIQIDSSYSRKQEGTGLGLSLTRKFIELHKGHIDFDSEPGKGSTFRFVLPEAKLTVSVDPVLK